MGCSQPGKVSVDFPVILRKPRAKSQQNSITVSPWGIRNSADNGLCRGRTWRYDFLLGVCAWSSGGPVWPPRWDWKLLLVLSSRSSEAFSREPSTRRYWNLRIPMSSHYTSTEACSPLATKAMAVPGQYHFRQKSTLFLIWLTKSCPSLVLTDVGQPSIS